MRTEIFVCDTCGERKRLDSRKEHWCKECAGKKETEMRPVRIKPLSLVSPMGARF
jgi:hypothetical protein